MSSYIHCYLLSRSRKGKMYWSDTVSRQLVEANINGSGVRVLLQQIDGQTGIYNSNVHC